MARKLSQTVIAKGSLVLPVPCRVNAKKCLRYISHETGVVLDIPVNQNRAFRRFVIELCKNLTAEISATRALATEERDGHEACQRTLDFIARDLRETRDALDKARKAAIPFDARAAAANDTNLLEAQHVA